MINREVIYHETPAVCNYMTLIINELNISIEIFT